MMSMGAQGLSTRAKYAPTTTCAFGVTVITFTASRTSIPSSPKSGSAWIVSAPMTVQRLTQSSARQSACSAAELDAVGSLTQFVSALTPYWVTVFPSPLTITLRHLSFPRTLIPSLHVLHFHRSLAALHGHFSLVPGIDSFSLSTCRFPLPARGGLPPL